MVVAGVVAVAVVAGVVVVAAAAVAAVVSLLPTLLPSAVTVAGRRLATAFLAVLELVLSRPGRPFLISSTSCVTRFGTALSMS